MIFFKQFFFPPTRIEVRTSVSNCPSAIFSFYPLVILVIQGFFMSVLELVLKQNPVGWLQKNH